MVKMETNKNNSLADGRRLRLLVTIASYGDKNLELLQRIIRDYRNMAMDVDVVVLSNAPKNLDAGVRVIVGLPTEDPWSLPFAHKPVLAENVEKYDLFVYTEDDMAVTEKNIRAFLRLTPQLDPGEIAGYLRYEVDQSGKYSLPDVHGVSRWVPESVHRRGEHIVAEFTNEHAAFFLLTQAQLRRAIASGGFLREPCVTRYDMACTAATDPYTNCGFRKVVCISTIDDFLIHHLSNRYAGQLGTSMELFKEQLQTMLAIQNGAHPASTLCETASKFLNNKWSKSLYEEPDEKFLKLIPKPAKTVLSIGCGWGAAEAKLKERGLKVTALPLDSVIGARAAKAGIEVIYGSLEKSLAELSGRTFDCVLMTNLLHLLPNPGVVLEQCSGLVGRGGTLIVSGPNLKTLRVQLKQMMGKSDYGKLGAHREGGVTVFGPGTLKQRLKKNGFQSAEVRFQNPGSANGALTGLAGLFPGLAAEEWVLEARR
jgi:2-polyprenyl-3-methyl-5-hydroxy-6-metoxy-1,4-benzoquinol methylase